MGTEKKKTFGERFAEAYEKALKDEHESFKKAAGKGVHDIEGGEGMEMMPNGRHLEVDPPETEKK